MFIQHVPAHLLGIGIIALYWASSKQPGRLSHGADKKTKKQKGQKGSHCYIIRYIKYMNLFFHQSLMAQVDLEKHKI